MIELTQGQEIELVDDAGKPLSRLRMGVGWDKNPTAGFIGTGAPEIDLDEQRARSVTPHPGHRPAGHRPQLFRVLETRIVHVEDRSPSMIREVDALHS